jgi:uncharacterized protein YxjI
MDSNTPKGEKNMHSSLHNNQYFVKENLGIFKAANNYDIFDPQTNQKILECREPNLGFFTKLLRFTDYKRMTPFNIEIRTPDGQLAFSVKRGISIFFSKVDVLDENGSLVGHFKQKLFSIGGKFDVLSAENATLCTLQGKWTSWDFRFIQGSSELASVTKKWAGLGKELFTSADNYMLSINDSVGKDDNIRTLVLASVMCIDMVLKE